MEDEKVRKNVVFRLCWKSRSKMAAMVMAMALMVIALPVDVGASRGPPRISDVVEPIVGNIGETLRLPCPVDGEPAPLFEWFKDGESLIMADDRIRATKNGLKITDAEVDDSGIYECKAVNGFGQVSIEVELWIRDSPSMSGGGSNYDDEEEEFDEDGFHRPNSISKSHQHGSSSGPAGGPSPDTTPRVPTPPTIVDHSWGDGAGPMMGGVFRQIPGSGIRLRCVVLGEPRPWVKWYKDGMEQSGSDWRSKVESRWSFVIENLKRADSGVYTCRAGNKLGTVSVNFTLEIFDDMTDKPEMMDEHPMNTTVIAGESTTLQCRVKSDSQPRIQWLKRLESRSEEAKYLNDSVPLQGDRYRILNTSTTTTVAKDTYLNRLVVTATKREDSGLYVCLAANKMGYSFRKAFLTVEPSPLSPAIAEEISPNGVGFVPETSPSLYIVFSLVALVVVILVASIAMYYFKRKYSPVGTGTVSSLRNGSLGTMGPHGGLMNGVSAGGMGTTGMVGHFDGVGLGMPGFGSGSPNSKKAAIVVANGNGNTGRHILSNQQQQQPFLTHHLDTQQPTAVLGGLRGVQPSLGDDYLTRQQHQQQQQREGFRYKLVPQQETPPAPPYPHQTGIYRESSSDVSSSHLYQKLPLGSSAASPNGLSIGPGSRSTPDNASNCRLCVVAGYQGFPGQHQHHHHQQQQLHQQPPRGYPGRGNGVESCREFVHFTSGMSHPV